MGGRGTFASGINVDFTYKTVAIIEGVKVLQSIVKGGHGKLPEESHSSDKYLLVNKNGEFQRMRIYNKQHKAIMDIDYHKERQLGNSKTFHVHEFDKPGIENRKNTKPRLLTKKEYKKYNKYFKGVI